MRTRLFPILLLLLATSVSAETITQFNQADSEFSVVFGTEVREFNISVPAGHSILSAQVDIAGASVETEELLPADIVIVTDTSESMRYDCGPERVASPGETPCKINDAKTAAISFVQATDLSIIQIGLVEYDSCPSFPAQVQMLTQNEQVLLNEINSYVASGNTNMGLGMKLAIDELLSQRSNTQFRRYMLVMTDGWTNRDENCNLNQPAAEVFVRAQAQRAEENGITVYGVAFGECGGTNDVGANCALTQEITSNGQSYVAPTAQDLEDIYNQIAIEIQQSAPIPALRVTRPFVQDAWESIGQLSGSVTWSGSSCPPGEATCSDFAQLLQQVSDSCSAARCNITFEVSSPTQGLVTLSNLEAVTNAPPVLVPRCGDNVRDPGEQCDGNDLGGVICTDLGFVEGTLSCNDQCEFDTSQCDDTPSPVCGNGILESGEQCEPGLPPPTCADVGFDGGIASCTSSCALDTSQCTTNEPPTNDGRCVIDVMQCGETTAGFLLDDPSNPIVFDPDDPIDSLTWVLSDRDSNNGQFSINTPLPAPGIANRRFIATLISSIYLPFSERFTFTVSDPHGASVEACYDLSYAACELRDIDIEDRTVDFGFEEQANGGLQYDLTDMIVTPPAELACPEADIIWTVSNPASMFVAPPVNGIVTISPLSWFEDATSVIDVTAACPSGESDEADLTVNYHADDAPSDQISCESVQSLVLAPSATFTVADLFNVPSSLGGIASVETSEPATVIVQNGLPDITLTSNGLQGSTVVSARVRTSLGRLSPWCDLTVIGGISSCSTVACDSCFALGGGARDCLAANSCFDRDLPIVVRNPTEFSPVALTSLANNGEVALSTTDTRFKVDPAAGSGNDVYELSAESTVTDGERAALKIDVTPENVAGSIRFCYDLVRSDIPAPQDPDSDLVSPGSGTITRDSSDDVNGRGPFIFTARVWLRK